MFEIHVPCEAPKPKFLNQGIQVARQNSFDLIRRFLKVLVLPRFFADSLYRPQYIHGGGQDP